ncbi:MAG: phosphatase domain-containing protein [Parafilimonas sp.]
MHSNTSIETIKPRKTSLSLKQKSMQWFRLNDMLAVKLYHGYAYENKFFIQGHVFSLKALPRKRYRNKLLVNIFSLIRLFIVKTVAGAHVQLHVQGKLFQQKTDDNGFFKFEGLSDDNFDFGWNEITADLLNGKGAIITTSNGFIFAPYITQYGFISDIDDTFLISHSASVLKRLRILFTNNARSRKPFEGVIEHYKLLSQANTVIEKPNAFFYVSSSEWNLYDYIAEFARVNDLPRGIFLLNRLKKFSQLFKTGKNNHGGKYDRIAQILQAFPKQQFILLGDSSQQDPYIYTSLVDNFPGRIYAVYIRDIYEKNREKVKTALMKLDDAGIAYCFFVHSAEAIEHSKKIGLINS